MKRSRKIVSILLTLALLATLLVPMATPAFAAATYSAVSVTNATGNAFQALGTLKVDVSATDIRNGDFVYVRLPNDYRFFTAGAVANGTIFANNAAAGSTSQIGAVGNTNVEIDFPQITNPFSRNDFQITLSAQNELKIMYNVAAPTGVSAGVEKNGYFYIRLNNVYVPGGTSGEVKATFEGMQNSVFSSGQVVMATVGAGSVSMAIDSVKTVPQSSAGTAIDVIRLKEDRAGALIAADDSIKLKLPAGFKWSAVPAGAVIWGNASAGSAAHAGVWAWIDPADTRQMYVSTGGAGAVASTVASYITLTGAQVGVQDETIAKSGDIVVDISGRSSVTPSSLVVGNYGDYGVNVESVETKDVKAGQLDQEIGKFSITESTSNSLISTRTVTLALTGGAKWNATPDLSIDSTLSDQQGVTIGAWAAVGSTGDSIKATVTNIGGSKGAKIVFQKGTIDLPANAAGDIKVLVSGTAGATGEAVIAKVVKPATAVADGAVPDVMLGVFGQKIADVIVSETVKEGMMAPTTFVATGGGGLCLEFYPGILPGQPAKVEVIEGDLVIDPTSVARSVTADGRWQVSVQTKSQSTVPSKVKFSGMTVNTDRTVPEGPMSVSVKGSAVANCGAIFPAFTTVASVKVANVVTPASTEVKNNASFVIDSNKYKVNGVEKTMDVAPYVKDGRTFLPVRYVAEALGVTNDNILWNESDQTVTLLKGDKVVQLKVGSKDMLVNGVTVSMDVAAEITSGRTMLPMRFIAQALGATVSWDEATKTVTLK